ncbi:MAG: hypothetical protein ACYCYO_02215 [Bacilli bacterium]
MKIHQIILAETVGVGVDGKVGAHGVHPGFIVLSIPPQTGYFSSHTLGVLVVGVLSSPDERLEGILKLTDHEGHTLINQLIDQSTLPQIGLSSAVGNLADLKGAIITAQMVNFPFQCLGTHYVIFEDKKGNPLHREPFEVTAQKPRTEQ